MADINWPSTLPPPLTSGYAEKPPANNVSWKPDYGPAYVRRRSTSEPRRATYQFRLNKDQVSTLDTFFVSTTKNGILRFNWTNPLTGVSCEATFDSNMMGANSSPISYSSLSHDVMVTVSLEMY